jgi:2-heptyl-3-hydroxy-4(1H)-quinolone synthase
MSVEQINIAGAGIAGLTAALALRQRGFPVSIFERSAHFAPVGAGIVLAPNALRILTDLGVDVRSHGAPIAHFQVRDRRGRPLQKLDLTRLPHSLGLALAFHRAELHETLARSLPTDGIRFEHPYSPALGRKGAVLIGADGIDSAVRAHTLGPVPLRYSGFTCWRGICRNPGLTEALEDWGGAARVGMVPLTGQRLYVFLVKAAPRRLPRQTSLAAIRAEFEGFASPVSEVLAALAESELLHHDLEELAKPVWGQGGTVLIGDAAHAMTPNLGQGASMAIEDAVLLPSIVHTSDPASALARRREARVVQIQRRSRWLGELAHWQSPVAVSLRNLVLRSLPQWVGECQYAQMIEASPAVGPDS